MIRKILASFLILLFVVISLPNFLLYALNSTFLDANFYSSTINEQTYDLLLRTSTEKILASSPVIKQYSNFTELRTEIGDVFTFSLFQKMMTDFSKQITDLKSGSSENLQISFAGFRESLITALNNVTYKIYQKLPICNSLADFKLDSDEIPNCNPSNVDYKTLMDPLSRNFENVVYASIPEDATLYKNPETAFIYNFFSYFANIKLAFLIVLVVILGLIALTLFRPFSLILKYNAIAFVLSGIAGLGMSFTLGDSLKQFFVKMGNFSNTAALQDYSQFLFNFFTTEIQKLSFIFLVVGFGLMMIFTFLRKSFD